MISLIVAYDKNKCIGNENTIPWRLKADMQRVKSLTTNQTILMGRKTFDSIGKPLPNRINRVLTKNKNFNYDGIEVYYDKKSSLENINTEKIFIFGGSTIYEQYIENCEELFITEVDAIVEGDSYFPNINIEEWNLISKESFLADTDNEYNYTFLHYTRKVEK